MTFCKSELAGSASFRGKKCCVSIFESATHLLGRVSGHVIYQNIPICQLRCDVCKALYFVGSGYARCNRGREIAPPMCLFATERRCTEEKSCPFGASMGNPTWITRAAIKGSLASMVAWQRWTRHPWLADAPARFGGEPLISICGIYDWPALGGRSFCVGGSTIYRIG